MALEIAARRPERVTALALLCAGLPGHEPSAELDAFDEREDALIEAGDLAGAVELNVGTWLGPDADEAAREGVRRMQRHAFEVQLAALEEAEDPGAPKRPRARAPKRPRATSLTPCPTYRRSRPPASPSPARTTSPTSGRSPPGCRPCSPAPATWNCPGPVTSPVWNEIGRAHV